MNVIMRDDTLFNKQSLFRLKYPYKMGYCSAQFKESHKKISGPHSNGAVSGLDKGFKNKGL
jgi:hypothetical protein